ncbi:MAG TPA: hypothetical protein VFQ44_26405 [Streptosporangiaceae bacterium]|nr:hypothetical protein [Streptosporangiaceae bacterium]
MGFDAFFKDLADPYSRRARLYPGLIVTLPISILAIVLVTTKPTWWSAVVVLLGASGASYLGSQLVRSAGRGKQAALWASWGGAPTTQLLRFRDAPNRVSVQRRHAQLTRVFPDLVIPDETSESAEPAAADQHYEVAIKALIERTRDSQRFDRVFDENCQYGFRRNLWGCRTIAIWLAGVGLAVTAGLGALQATDVLNISILGLGLSGGIDVLLLIVFGAAVRSNWVREAGEAYAERLVGSLETL